MNRRPSILFRCEASPEIGMGHLIRCLALAEELQKTPGFQVSFAVNFDATGAPTTSSDPGFAIVDGAWKLGGDIPKNPATCTATETDADGATATSWTCAFEAVLGKTRRLGGLWISVGTRELGAGSNPSSCDVGFRTDSVGSSSESRRGPEGPYWSLIDPERSSRRSRP